jgi:hypothetical protein
MTPKRNPTPHPLPSPNRGFSQRPITPNSPQSEAQLQRKRKYPNTIVASPKYAPSGSNEYEDKGQTTPKSSYRTTPYAQVSSMRSPLIHASIAADHFPTSSVKAPKSISSLYPIIWEGVQCPTTPLGDFCPNVKCLNKDNFFGSKSTHVIHFSVQPSKIRTPPLLRSSSSTETTR